MNSLASEFQQFGCIYHRVFSRAKFPGCSPRPVVQPKAPRRSRSTITFSEPKPTMSLNQIAHLATRSDFEVYPEIKLSPDMFGPRPHNLLVSRQVQTAASIERSELDELNRLARLVEMTSSRIPDVPVYASAPRISESLAHNKLYQQIIAGLLSFTSAKNPSVRNDFSVTFPATKVVISHCLGQPKIERQIFNSLLASKMSELRSRLGINFSPVGSINLVSSWINMSLKRKQNPSSARSKRTADSVQKGRKPTSTSEQKVNKNKVAFVPAADVNDNNVTEHVAKDVPPHEDARPVSNEYYDDCFSMLSSLSLDHRYAPLTPMHFHDAISDLRILRDSKLAHLNMLKASVALGFTTFEHLRPALAFLFACNKVFCFPKHSVSYGDISGSFELCMRPDRFELSTTGPFVAGSQLMTELATKINELVANYLSILRYV